MLVPSVQSAVLIFSALILSVIFFFLWSTLRRSNSHQPAPEAKRFYRLNVISLTLPPLRERREDIPLLAYYFVAKYSKKCKRLVSGISPETRNCLFAYDWPGNVHELENAIERAVVLGNSEVIVPDDLPESLLATSPAPQSLPNYHEAVNEMKKKFILQAIEQANGNYTAAAKLLGIHSTNLHRLIRTLGLRTSISSG